MLDAGGAVRSTVRKRLRAGAIHGCCSARCASRSARMEALSKALLARADWCGCSQSHRQVSQAAIGMAKSVASALISPTMCLVVYNVDG